MSGIKPLAAEHLLARMQIEDLLYQYYTVLVDFEREGMAYHFTEDGILDLNGKVFKGHAEIDATYADSSTIIEGGTEATPKGTYRMLLNNPVIQVKGDTATAHLLYTGFMCEDVRKPPRLVEMGREYTEFVKVDGRWLISKRLIRSDAGALEPFASYLDTAEKIP